MIDHLAERIRARREAIEAWLERDFAGLEPPVYSSVDVRNAGFKISVVDTNLYPAGFNNLCETFATEAARQFRLFLERYHPEVRTVGILPEDHTRNEFYWKSVAALQRIVTEAGCAARVGRLEEWRRSGPDLLLHNERPDLILLNNDLSEGCPPLLQGLDQLILPSPQLGWHRRRKSDHFKLYRHFVGHLAGLLEVDPWLLAPLSEAAEAVRLDDPESLGRLAAQADRMLADIAEKYREHGVTRAPYLFVKNNQGTYGMAVTHVASGSELLRMNRKLRNKLSSAKGGAPVVSYLLQEGIPTADFYRNQPLEPVLYLIGGEPVGSFFRLHAEKTEKDNLNARGMTFSCLCFHKLDPPSGACRLAYDDKDHLFSIDSLLGRVAALAASHELTQLEKSLAA